MALFRRSSKKQASAPVDPGRSRSQSNLAAAAPPSKGSQGKLVSPYSEEALVSDPHAASSVASTSSTGTRMAAPVPARASEKSASSKESSLSPTSSAVNLEAASTNAGSATLASDVSSRRQSTSTHPAPPAAAPSPHVDMSRDDTDYTVYDQMLQTPVQELPHGDALKNRYRSKSMSVRLKALFKGEEKEREKQAAAAAAASAEQSSRKSSVTSNEYASEQSRRSRSASVSTAGSRSRSPSQSVPHSQQQVVQSFSASGSTASPGSLSPPIHPTTTPPAISAAAAARARPVISLQTSRLKQTPHSRSSSPSTLTAAGAASPRTVPASPVTAAVDEIPMSKLSIMPPVPENALDDIMSDPETPVCGPGGGVKSPITPVTPGYVDKEGHRHHHHHHHHHHGDSTGRSRSGTTNTMSTIGTTSSSVATSRANSSTSLARSIPSSPQLNSLECPMSPILDAETPPISRSGSVSGSGSTSASAYNSSRKRATSISANSAIPAATSSVSESSSPVPRDGFLSALKHSQSVNYSSAHLLNQKMFKGKSGRIKVSMDGKTHEHNYTKYKTTPVKANKGMFGWMKRKEEDEDGSIEKSLSLLPDSYSLQLMDLKSNPENYRWNYDDDDEDGEGDGGSDDDDPEEEIDETAFDDEADDELIEPIIGKEQLRLINVMMEKIEHKDKFIERLHQKGSNKMPLVEKYGRIEGFIGKGSYGTVSIAAAPSKDKKHKVYYAVKQLKQRAGESLHHFGNRVTSEFMISSCLTHQAIINVYDLMVDPVTMSYSQVMEFMPCGDLFSLISSTNGLEVTECDCFFKQILNALTYLHSVGISHNDLKVENLLLTKKGQLKIIDFGTSAVFKTAWEDHVQYSRGPCGSERYCSPEQYDLKHDYDPRLADVWSLGIIYLVMFFGNYCWDVAKDCDERFETYLETRALFDYSKRSSTLPKQFKLKRKGMFNQIESISGGPYPNSRRYVLYNILNPDPKYRMRTYQIWQSDWVKNFQVCDAGRGYLSYNDYIDMALQQLHDSPPPPNVPTTSAGSGTSLGPSTSNASATVTPVPSRLHADSSAHLAPTVSQH